MKDFSAVFNAHPQYIESLYRSWQDDPHSVESDWSLFFKGFDFALSSGNGNGAAVATPAGSGAELTKEFAVLALIHGYRNRGHMVSTTNPIRPRKDRQPRLALADCVAAVKECDKRLTEIGRFTDGGPVRVRLPGGRSVPAEGHDHLRPR